MDTIEFISVPVIVTVVYTLITLLKQAVGNNESFLKFVPLIAAGFGAALGLIAYLSDSNLIPANNIFVALMVGGSSGLAATGTHQVFKQIASKPASNDNTESPASDNSEKPENQSSENSETKTGE